MARPITVTPVLEGQDAEVFSEKVKQNEKKENKISNEEYQKAMANYKKFKQIATF